MLYNGAAVGAMALRLKLGLPHEVDYEVFRHLRNTVCFVDGGANRGQSAVSFGSVSRLPHRIVSFEANARNEPYLEFTRRLIGPRFTYHLCGLGQEQSFQTFYVPVQGSRRITTEGSFRRAVVVAASRRIEGPYEIGEETFEVRTLDSFDVRPDIVKLDVQGLELEVLRGMEQIFEHGSPLLMLEASQLGDDAIGRHLSRFGYQRWRARGPEWLLTRAPLPGRPLNWFYASEATVGMFPELFEGVHARSATALDLAPV